MMKKKIPATAAIILAAGKGTRMKSTLPKVMHPVAGFAMVSHVAYQAAQAGLTPTVLVVGPGMEAMVSGACANTKRAQLVVQKQQLGTAHAVLAAKGSLKNFRGNLIVLYGDTPLLTAATIGRLNDVLAKDATCAVAVLGFVPADAAGYGRLVTGSNGALERIVEAKDASAAEKRIRLCNSGVMALRGDVAWQLLENIDNKNAKKEYYLTDVVARAREAGFTARAIEGEAWEVLGINSRTELAMAEAALQQQLRQYHMENGVTLLDPASVYFAADTEIGADTLVEPHVFFGPGVRIGKGAHIKAFSHIEGSAVGADAVVGPFTRLRPGTELGAQVKIGNFVELKKSKVAAGAKISHLSYIGDATVGAEANIGAGTITCNYDGYNKHDTVIGKGVFVGSNTALVAPVKIGDGAIIAAGSVITENVAADALALARTRQEQKKTWAKSFRAKQSVGKKKK